MTSRNARAVGSGRLAAEMSPRRRLLVDASYKQSLAAGLLDRRSNLVSLGAADPEVLSDRKARP